MQNVRKFGVPGCEFFGWILLMDEALENGRGAFISKDGGYMIFWGWTRASEVYTTLPIQLRPMSCLQTVSV